MLKLAPPTTLRHRCRDVTACAVAKDQSIVATGCEDGSVHLWEVSTGSLLQTFKKIHEGRVHGLAFNKDAAVLASVAESGELIWWFLDQKGDDMRYRQLEGHGGCAILCCVFAGNYPLMASGSKDGDVILWGSYGRPVHHRLQCHTNWVNAVLFNPAATILFSASYDHSVALWDAVQFTVIRVIRLHEAAVLSLAVSIEGSVLASGDSLGTVLLTRVSDGVCLRALRGHEDGVAGVAFIDNIGLVVTGSADETVKIWELRGKCLKSFRAHTAAITCLVVAPTDEMIVTVGEDYCARVFPYAWKRDDEPP